MRVSEAQRPNPSGHSFSVAPSLADGLRLLDKEPFAFARTDLTAAELVQVGSLEVVRQAEWSRFGGLTGIGDELTSFLASTTRGGAAPAIRAAAGAVERVTTQVMKAAGHTHAWVTMRAFLPSTSYDIPRWHFDGMFFGGTRPQHKVAGVLSGSATLFAKVDQTTRARFLETDQRLPRLALATCATPVAPIARRWAARRMGNACNAPALRAGRLRASS